MPDLLPKITKWQDALSLYMIILGLSAFYHDSAACLVRDGKIVAAAQEERFTRRKHDAGFPTKAIAYCLQSAGVRPADIDVVAFYEKPLLKLERIFSTYSAYAPVGREQFMKFMPRWWTSRFQLESSLDSELGYRGKVLYFEHHESHAMSAFYPSPFVDAAILTLDGVGEWSTTSLGIGEKNRVRLLSDLRFPHSLGLLYSAITNYIGFKVNSGEYKVMGLAPYGQPKYKQLLLDNVIDLKPDGSFRLNMDYFDFAVGDSMVSPKFEKLFGGPARTAETLLTQREMDIARSVQEVTEDVVLAMARHARKVTGKTKLCMAGGVALNCVANGKILSAGIFDDLWIQPASGDAGGALGAALGAWYQYHGGEREPDGRTDAMNGSFLGPEYSSDEIRAFLDQNKIPYTRMEEKEVPGTVAALIGAEKVVGWFGGRMEFGPRSLGARSIIGDPRSAKMQEVMNLKIKFRESFRPFAPSVRADDVQDWFEMTCASPYMLLVAPVRASRQRKMTAAEESLFGIEKLNIVRSEIPAVTHVDYSARVQTVHRETNARYYDLIGAFKRDCGCPVIVNTSFNVRGEPPVCSPEDAYRCFMRTHIDYLVLEDYLLAKVDQPKTEGGDDWKKEFELD